MKKSLIALAVLGAFSAGAAAQSSVTVYGVVDLSLQYTTSGLNRGTTALPNYEQESVWGINSGYTWGSRLGFRGSEALGGGLNVIFQLEAGFNADTGSQGTAGILFNRVSQLGLQGNFGTVALGRFGSPSSGTGPYDMFGPIDPFGTAWGVNGMQSTFIPLNSLREDNSVIYMSPKFAGFQGAAMYSFNIGGNETVPQGSNLSAFNLGASWGAGPFYVAATYDVLQFPDTVAPLPSLPDQKMFQLGGTFDFKIVKFALAYGDFKNTSLAITNSGAANPIGVGTFVPVGIGNLNYQAYMAGITVNLGKAKLIASYQKADGDNVIAAGGLAQFEPDWDAWGLGVEYGVSRRTFLYAGYGQRSWDGTIRSSLGVVVPNLEKALDKDQFAMGIRHHF
jgi:predicted porin